MTKDVNAKIEFLTKLIRAGFIWVVYGLNGAYNDRMSAKIVAIPSRVLLGLYLILPFSSFLVIVDFSILENAIRNMLPRDPHSLPFFAMFFHLPHIIGSSVILLDKEFIQFYSKTLLIGVPLIIAAMILIPLVVGMRNSTLLFVFITIVHVIGQQMGIARMLLGKINITDFNLWKYISLPLWSLCGFIVLARHSFSTIVLSPFVFVVGLILFIVATFYVYRMCRDSQHRIGRWYLISTHVLLAVGAWFIYLQYPFFAILCPRIVHDCTAFAFYMALNQNRFSEKQSNFVFRLLSVSGIPIFILCPITAIALTQVLSYSSFYFGTILATFFILFHYLTEAITWRRSGLYRQYIKIT